MPGSEKQNSMFKKTRGYVQGGNPFAVTSCGRRRNTGQSIFESDSPLEKRKRKKSNEPRKTTKGKGRNFRTIKEGAGMTSKGVKEYRRKNPGSKLKTAVTGKVKPGSKDAKRRKSFCARSKGWTGERGKAARRRWKC
tara:strand:- start:566 stop:976 length:411 start_codon:yes stop_codon:yes gene_type:complete